jgi:ATP-dependent RNA helicase RhlE
LALNLNRIQTLIIDDAEEIIKQGMQNTVRELAESCGKVQHLVFSTVEHQKLYDMIDNFMNENCASVEIDELENDTVDTLDLLLYHVPNFTTKINLLNLLLQDKEVFQKVVVFVNSKLTAQSWPAVCSVAIKKKLLSSIHCSTMILATRPWKISRKIINLVS